MAGGRCQAHTRCPRSTHASLGPVFPPDSLRSLPDQPETLVCGPGPASPPSLLLSRLVADVSSGASQGTESGGIYGIYRINPPSSRSPCPCTALTPSSGSCSARSSLPSSPRLAEQRTGTISECARQEVQSRAGETPPKSMNCIQYLRGPPTRLSPCVW